MLDEKPEGSSDTREIKKTRKGKAKEKQVKKQAITIAPKADVLQSIGKQDGQTY